MRVYVLLFEDEKRLNAAMAIVMQDDYVDSCSSERDLCRLRFLAPLSRADRLVERIYADGGLVWCSRHDVRLSARLGDPRTPLPGPRA